MVLDNVKNNYIRQTIPYATITLCVGLFVGFMIELDKWNFEPWLGEDLKGNTVKTAKLGLEYPEVVDDIKIWQYFTMFMLHRSLFHLFSNLGALFIFGYSVERQYTWKTLIPTFLLGSASAGFLFVAEKEWSDDSDKNILIGSSGGAYALIGLYISNAWINSETVLSWPIYALVSFLMVFLTSLEYYFFATEGVAVLGHFGGLLFGLFPALILIKNYKLENWEYTLYTLAGLGCLFFFVVLPIVIYS